MAQAWTIYQQFKSYLRHYGSTMKDIVHQSLYMTNPADYHAAERIATLFYGKKLPPTRVVPVMGYSPYHQCELEIDPVAVVPDQIFDSSG